jgi:hypothetical protein
VRLLSVAVSAVLFVLAALHVAWALRGRAPAVTVPMRTDGTPLFRPGRLVTLGVAAALALAGLIVLARVAANDGRLVPSATWMLTIAFTARAVGDFRYVGLFKRQRSTPFARWDTRLFTPLCVAIAAAVAVLAAS